jgi:hypothetical protein
MTIKYGKPIASNSMEVTNPDGESLSVTLEGSATVSTEGSQSKLEVSDNNTEALLTDILKELRKMNLHLSLITDVHIENSEVG